MDALFTLRLVAQVYLGAVALLGAVTLVWALANAVLFDTVTLAVLWFGFAGLGTLLVVWAIVRHYGTALGGSSQERTAQ